MSSKPFDSSDEDDDEWRPRHWPKSMPRRDELIQMIDELYERSGPDGEPSSSFTKDDAASDALICGSMLFGAVAGWAVDHQIGLAVSNLDTPVHLVRNTDIAALEDLRSRTNSHQHEIKGARLRDSRLSPEVARRALTNILTHMGGFVFPEHLANDLRDGFDALNFGELTALLTPSNKGRVRYRRELRQRLRALTHIDFRVHGSGMTYDAAREHVADFYGLKPQAFRRWDKMVREGLGEVTYYDARLWTMRCADSVRAAKKKPTDKILLSRSIIAELAHSDDVLAQDGKLFKVLIADRRRRKRSPRGKKKER